MSTIPRFLRSDTGILIPVDRIESMAPLDERNYLVVTATGKHVVSADQIHALVQGDLPKVTRNARSRKKTSPIG